MVTLAPAVVALLRTTSIPRTSGSHQLLDVTNYTRSLLYLLTATTYDPKVDDLKNKQVFFTLLLLPDVRSVFSFFSISLANLLLLLFFLICGSLV